MTNDTCELPERVQLALADGLSPHELARIADVSSSTVAELERGGPVDQVSAIRVAEALSLLEWFAGDGDLIGDAA
jgi:hypothetical protein